MKRTNYYLKFVVLVLFVSVVGFSASSIFVDRDEVSDISSTNSYQHYLNTSGTQTLSDDEAILYDQSELVSNPGAGAGGADASAITDPGTLFGFGNQLTASNRMADDFTIPAGESWQIDSIILFHYQTGSTTTSTINNINLQIWNGVTPGTGSIVAGDSTTNRMGQTYFSNIYRVTSTTLTNNQRPIMRTQAVMTGTTLPAGTYWIDYTAGGTLASGPWNPPRTIVGQPNTGNAYQRTGTTWAWAPAVDGANPQGVPFIIHGTSIPDVNSNSGNNGQIGDNLYYFANSLATGAPSFPTYNWRDTTGSTNLVLNGVATATINNGNLDDGRFDVIGQLPGTNAIRFFGVNYTDFYIGTNGFVAFYPLTNASSTWNIPASGLPNATVTNAYFAFWKDLNYGDVDVPVNRLSYKITSTEVIITFDRAPNFNTGTDANDYVSFQIIMEHAPAPATNTRMFTMFNFDQTGSSFITKYNGNTLAAHIIGLQNANAADKILSYRFRNAGGVINPEGPIFGSNLAVAYGADQNALPVDLLSFTANVDGNNVTLNWSTAWEENNMRFDVQRKNANADAQWNTIGSVNGKGTTYEVTNYEFHDRNLTTGIYEYRLVQIDFNGNSTADFNLNQVVEVGVPTRFDLAQNYPNPFNPTTKIDFQIPVEGLVKLSVFDMSGREVATLVNEALTPGYYSYNFNGANIASGVYFYRLVAANSVTTKKMLLIK